MGRYLYLAILGLLFLAGCSTLQQNVRIGCCDPAEAEDGTCALRNSENVEVVETYSCDAEDALTCEVRLRIISIMEDGSREARIHDPDPETVPICTEVEEVSCVQGECHAQVCGPFNYRPKPIISYRDTLQLQEDLEEGETDLPGGGEEEAANLYLASCLPLPMDENLSTVFSNTRGSFINSFRFGVGKTFEEFEKYRRLFPFSDAYCNANPMGTKDRFSNYLKTPGEEIDDVLAQFDDLLYCPTERFRSPFRNDLFGSTSEPPNYNFETVRRYGDGGLQLETQDFDRNFYDNILRWVYQEELEETVTFEDPVAATFECGDASQCKSAQCDTKTYLRGMCQNDDNEWVNCQCFSNGRECKGETVWTTDIPGVTTLDDAIDQYNSGGDLYLRTERKVEFYYNSFNPACSDGHGVDGWSDDSVDDQIYYCQEDGCFFYNEPDPDTATLQGGVAIQGRQVYSARGDQGWDEPDEFGDYHLECEKVEGNRNDCERTDNPNTEFRLYGAAGQFLIPSTSGTPFSTTCPDGISSSEPFLCDQYRNMEAGVGDTDEWESISELDDNPEDILNHFPNGIYFFGESKQATPLERGSEDWPDWANAIGDEEYIGYTLLSPEEFQKTNFYQACGLADSSYDVLDITPRVSWINADGMRQVQSGYLWMSGPGGRYWRYLDGLDITIPLVSAAHGFVKRSEASCSGDGDTRGKYWFPRYVLFLKDTANCKMTNSMPKTEAFGWCEGCSYLTMSQQEMLAGDGYRNLEERRYRRSSGSPYSTAIKCLEFPGADGPGCSLEHGDGTTEFIAFDAPLDQEPESLYLLEQQATYLKEGVLPVLDLTDRSNWQEVNGGALAAARRKINNAQTWMEWASGGPGSGGAIAALQELISRMGRGIGDFGYEELIRTLEDIGQRLDSANTELAITSDQLIAAEARLSDDRPAAMGSLAEALPHLSNGANNVTAAYNRMIPICDGLYGESWLGTRIYDPGIWALTPLPDLCNAMEVNIFTNVDEARREIIGELHQVGDGVLPRGPTILIVGEVNESVDEDEVALMKLRASIAKQICGRCLVGIQIDNGPSGSLGGKERFTKDFVAAEKLPNIDPESLNNVDVIAIGVYPHEFVQENSALCGSDELYETVLEELRIFGRHMLSEPVEKFTLVSRMELDRDVEPQCWEDTGGENINEDPVYRLFGTLAVRQRTLTQNGVLGMIYSETDALEETVSGGRTYSDQFCSLEKASRLLVSDPAITVYNQIELQDEVTCQQCEADEISSGACSRTCGNGRQCTMPEDVPVDGEDFYRCPDQGYPGPSIPCSSIEDKNLACQRVYGDGRVEQIRVPMSDLDAGFPDVIASIPYGYRCNVDDETGQYTFTKVDVRGKAGAPIIFSYGSNADEDCGVPDFNLPAPQQCSDTSLPIRDYRIQCQFEDGPPDPWPPPAMLELEIVDGG